MSQRDNDDLEPNQDLPDPDDQPHPDQGLPEEEDHPHGGPPGQSGATPGKGDAPPPGQQDK